MADPRMSPLQLLDKTEAGAYPSSCAMGCGCWCKG
jgi:hypothetical protein